MERLAASKFDYAAYLGYLSESEAELLKIGTTKCHDLHDKSQLAAVIFLLLRATSLFRSVLSLLESGSLDAYDAVRRAYQETWLLAFEFRLEESQTKAAQWHMGKSDSWSPDIRRLEDYARSQGISEPMLGKTYGGLSEVAHPTRSAAENSLAVVVAPHGDSVARTSLIEAQANFESKDVPMLMYRFLWLIIKERTGLIKIEADIATLPTAISYANRYAKTLSQAS